MEGINENGLICKPGDARIRNEIVFWDSLMSIFQNFIGKQGSVCKVNQTNICLPVYTTSHASFILFGCRLWLLINVCLDFITTALVSYDHCVVTRGRC